MNRRLIDLPLLAALDVLVAERSVTRAADRLHISQPAMSHILAKLRAAFDDPILVKSQGAMVPTAKAMKIVGPTRQAIAGLERALAEFQTFDPAREDSVIRIGTVDYVELIVMPRFMAALSQAAPGMRVLVRPLQSQQDCMDDLHTGRLDLAIAFFSTTAESLRRQRMGQEDYVCIAARGRFKAAEFDVRSYVSARHIVVSPLGDFETPALDAALRKHQLTRRVVYSASHFTTAAAVVERTELIATVQKGVAARMLREFRIDVLPLPFGTAPLVLSQIWHERTHKDAMFRWVRGLMEDASAQALQAQALAATGIHPANTAHRKK